MKGWIAVDFDGTLSVWQSNDTVGPPVPIMVRRVKAWIAKGYEVRIFTIRVSFKDEEKNKRNTKMIEEFCLEHIGKVLEVTCRKDYNCIQIWDDKAIRVIKNTGYSEDEYRRLKTKKRVCVTQRGS